ncbi:peptidase M15 [Nostoc sp. WHI]|uniref:peptidase M15 n=1 Tax=Nostoc sp. WHI TaxID=2650611 RepID=UPI0018C78743|nr:peptidase M15 [Nostoc sp. WHI]MBG1268330.1 peptidase M15 [Nostoc sp. WHI]
MKRPQTVKSLEELGRVRLSKNFFMRDFLHSEISQIEGIPNIPDNPDLAIASGKNLCEQVLEPIQQAFGRISIRSGYRSSAVNAKGAENKNQYNCASNASNYAVHIWDVPDAQGYMGATACIIVNSFIDYYEKTADWTALAWWIHDRIDYYNAITFFPKYAAFNIGWSENLECRKLYIYSYIPNPYTGKKGYLTRLGVENYSGSHEQFYEGFKTQLAITL